MLGYIISCIILGLILLGYVPAMIAASKNYSFVRWYLFGVFLFPFALIRSIQLKKPVRIINVLSSKESGRRQKKSYRKVPFKSDVKKNFSFAYILTVIFTKAIFGAFLGLVAFAIIRMFAPNTFVLRTICVCFSVIHTLLMSAAEVAGFSHLPIMADEITKRALQMFLISAIVSLPMFLICKLITTNIIFHTQFVRFLFTLGTFAIFLILLFRLQRWYYGRFSKFFDYCVLSLCAYTVFSATTLVMISISKGLRKILFALAMQMQLFNFTYFSGVEYIDKMSTIYLSAAVHLIVAVLLLLSGLRCSAFKKKELAYKVEYRTKAFRATLKPALYRHIPYTGIKIKKEE